MLLKSEIEDKINRDFRLQTPTDRESVLDLCKWLLDWKMSSVKIQRH